MDKNKQSNFAKPGFYGWFAVAGAMLAAFVDTGAFSYSYGVFLPDICAEFGWSRGMVAAGMTFGLLSFGLPSPLTGYLTSRFGPRGNIIFGNLLAALALAGMFMVQEIWQVYLLYSLAGLGAGLGGYIPAISTVNNWFVKKRSLATGIFFTSTSLSGFVFPPLVTLLISTVGWRMAWLVMAGIVFTGASLIGGIILIRNRPEDMGQAPDGIPVVPGTGTVQATAPVTEREPVNWSTADAFRQPATWLIGTFALVNLFGLNSLTGHQVAYMNDLGFSPVIAALALSLISGTGILGNLGFGFLALRTNMKNLVSAFFIVRLISLGLLLIADNLSQIYIFAVLFGISTGAVIVAMPTMLGAYYGRAHYSQILGVIFIMQVCGGAIGPAVTGAIYDATSTYTPAFILLTAISFVALICAFLASQPKSPQTT